MNVALVLILQSFFSNLIVIVLRRLNLIAAMASYKDGMFSFLIVDCVCGNLLNILLPCLFVCFYPFSVSVFQYKCSFKGGMR